ncbi:LOB domain-containing protein 2-like [Mangifera indica]|uniref:LOB domain-containing protein 2-like n=1 Tax=Mangifera indica TaxID=29780 RepID=UPI001CFB207E|nr:LOB domain-containing protein 2-like [Mangifera indica]
MQRNNSNSGGTSSVHSACAACKHQRKKCNEECKLAAYFPADRSREFQAVHKVFGVSNVTKIVHSVDEEERPKVVDSLIWEALWRQKNPVLGPYGEYKRLCEELKLYKSQAMMQNQNQNHQIVAGQGGILFQTPLTGWNNGTDNGMNIGELVVNNNTGSYINQDIGNSMIELETSYGYPPQIVQNPSKLKQEREVGGVVNIPLQQQPQQHSITRGFNQQQYYISGHFL